MLCDASVQTNVFGSDITSLETGSDELNEQLNMCEAEVTTTVARVCRESERESVYSVYSCFSESKKCHGSPRGRDKAR